MQPELPIAIRGTVSVKDEDRATVLLNDCTLLITDDRYTDTAAKCLYLRVPHANAPIVAQAFSIIGKAQSGASVILYDLDKKQYVKAVGCYADLTDSLVKSLSDLLGAENVAIK